MYQPSRFKMTDQNGMIAFMKRFGFATLITAKDGLPIASHLPFVVQEEDNRLFLLSHVAKQNEQWKDLEENTSLVIFREPHAYISPTHYEKELNVPTWNYIAVHAYGKGTLITDTQGLLDLLKKTIAHYEPSYNEQWDRLPEKYRLGQMNGITGFKIEVTDLMGKEKLSQNKTRSEQEKITAALSKSENSTEKILGQYMQQIQHG